MPAQTRRRFVPHAVRGIGRRWTRTQALVLPGGDVYVRQGARDHLLPAAGLRWTAHPAADAVWANVWTDRLYFLLELAPADAARLPPAGRQ